MLQLNRFIMIWMLYEPQSPVTTFMGQLPTTTQLVKKPGKLWLFSSMIMPHPISYLICTTPRSGSTLLCEALSNTGLAGHPDEFFGPMHVARWTRQWQTTSRQQYLQKVREQGSGPNGVWGAKIMRLYWQDFLGFLGRDPASTGLSESAFLNNLFPNLKYIFLIRRHKVRQAVSWLKFIQGAAWYWEQDEPQQLDNLTFQPEEIDRFLLQTTLHESAWLEFFARAGVQPFLVVYEDFVARYEETALDILDFLGVDRPKVVNFGKRRLRKQADALSDQWTELYLELNRHTERFPE